MAYFNSDWKLIYADGTSENISCGFHNEKDVWDNYYESENGSRVIKVEFLGHDYEREIE